MVFETYDFGKDVRHLTKEEAGKFTEIAAAAKKAKENGLGFIVGYYKIEGRLYRAIYAWDVKVISGREARKAYQDDVSKMNIIDESETEVFIVSPVADGKEILFPFKPFRKLRVVSYSRLVAE